MSGKQAKREIRRQKEAARAAARRKQRRQTMYTVGIIAVIVAIGGVLIWASLEREPGTEVACGGSVPITAELPRPTFDEAEQVLEEGVDYRAVIDTSCGQVVIDLDQDRAPQAVNSFVFLAQQGFFDGLEIFRNATGIGALQTGSGTNDASWQIGYALPDELEAAESDGYPPGTVAMANSGPDSAGSQFFFVYHEGFMLEPTYTRFGMVIEGLDVLEEIGAIETTGPQNEMPTQKIYLERVQIETVTG